MRAPSSATAWAGPARTRPGRAAQGGHRLVDPPLATQRRPVAETAEGGARLERAAEAPDFVKDLEEEAPPPLPDMTLSLEAKPEKPWLSAYQGLDTTIKVDPIKAKAGRTACLLAFIPLQTVGDLVMRKGMALPHGGDCVVTVTAARRARRAWLVIQAYDPVTSYTAKLHLGAREIIKLIEFDESRMTTLNSYKPQCRGTS